MTQESKVKVVVLLSGGMDSVVVLYESLRHHDVVAALSFDYGSKHNERELSFAALHCQRNGIKREVIKLDFMDRLFESALLKSGSAIPENNYDTESMRTTVVPFRNGIMLSIAAGYAASHKADGLVIAAHSGDHAIYPDCREEFMCSMSAAIASGTYAGIKLLRPFIDLTKAQIAERGAKLGIDFAETWSCYNGGAKHCGVCGTCRERQAAFNEAGLEDPTDWATREQ